MLDNLFRITLNEYGKIDKTSLESLLNTYKFPLYENSDTYKIDGKLYYSNKTFTIKKLLIKM